MARPRRPLRATQLASLALAGCLLLPVAADAQRQKRQTKEEPEPFFGSVDVNVVNVEVFVTDKDGKFVPGLTRDDFEVYEDGKPVEVTNFFVAEGAAAPAGEVTLEGSAAPAQASPLPPEQRLYLTIFFDNQSLIPPARNRLIDSLKSFVKTQLRPGDQVMVVSYEGPGSMKVRQASTRDSAALGAALDEVAAGSAGGLDRQMEFRLVLQQIDNTAGGSGLARRRSGDMGAGPEGALAAVRLYAEARHQEIRSSLKSLGNFVDALSGLPGRKALLYVSGGMSLRPAQSLVEAWQNKFGGAGGGGFSLSSFETDTTTRFREIGERANANRITFYSLGVPAVHSSTNAEARGASAWTRDQETLETLNLTQSLLLVAAPTGGLAALDPNKPEVLLGQMRHDFDHYYSLGYAAADRKSPGNHKIEVKVKRPGLQVRHREGYRDTTTRDRLNHQTMATLLLGAGADNPLGVGVHVEGERASRKKKGEREVSLLVTFPMSKLVLLPQAKVHEGRVTVLLGARDEQGRTSDITQIDVPVRVPQAQLAAALEQSVAYRATLMLRPGPHTLVVGVRDEYGNVNSTLTVPYGAERARAGR